MVGLNHPETPPVFRINQTAVQDSEIGIPPINVKDGAVPRETVLAEPRYIDGIGNDVYLVAVDPELDEIEPLCRRQHMEPPMAPYLSRLVLEVSVLEVDMQDCVLSPTESGWSPAWIGGMTPWDDFGPEPVRVGL